MKITKLETFFVQPRWLFLKIHTDEGIVGWKEPFQIVDGCIPLPTKPGLGIEVDEEALADKLYDGTWETPRLWHKDGSVADW